MAFPDKALDARWQLAGCSNLAMRTMLPADH